MTVAEASTRRHSADSRRQVIITVLVVIVGGVVVAWRFRERLFHPGIYAEDGPIFYLQADLLGPPAIVQPYAGYLHVVPRLVAAAVSPLGLSAVPIAYTVTTTALTVGAFALVLSARLSNVIPSVWARRVAFLLLCLTPPMAEVGGVLASLIFVGGLPLLLTSVSTPPATRRGRAAETVLIALLGLSGPLVVFYLPVFLYYWVRNRTWPRFTRLVVAAGAAAIQLLVYLTSGRTSGSFGAGLSPRVYLQRVVGGLLTSPQAAEQGFMDHTALRWVCVSWLLIAGAVAFLEVREAAVVLLAVTTVTFVWVVRTYGDVLISPDAHERHLLIPAATLLILLVGAADWAVRRARDGTSSRWRRIAHASAAIIAAVALLSTVGGIATQATLPGYPVLPSENQLKSFQECLDVGRRDCARVELSPPGFVMG